MSVCVYECAHTQTPINPHTEALCDAQSVEIGREARQLIGNRGN